MEVMDTCLDKFYKAAKKRNMQMPENILSKVTYAVSKSLIDIRRVKLFNYPGGKFRWQIVEQVGKRW